MNLICHPCLKFNLSMLQFHKLMRPHRYHSKEPIMAKGIEGPAGNSSFGDAAKYADKCRTVAAPTYPNPEPPKGPKPEPVRIDGVPKIKTSGLKK
jgi:hypothetical protein